jgi:DNA-binding MarR family transcriptional regulator
MARQNIDEAVVDFSHSIGLLVRRSRAVATSDELSWTETGVLKRLACNGPLTTADLARAQGMRPQSMRAVLASLEQLGMVQRRPHASDGRQVNIELTAKGAAAQRRAGDAKRTWMAQAIAQLSVQDQQTLFEAGNILKRLVEDDRA